MPKGHATLLALAFIISSELLAQTPDGHEQHHPPAATAEMSPSTPTAETPAQDRRSESRGCSGAGCGGTTREQLFPALMQLPDLPPERRANIERQAHSRMIDGARQMTSAATEISDAITRQDFAGMQEATAHMQAAVDQFESGLAAHRAITEGQAPRNIALRWFKREMNLGDPLALPPPHGLFGLSAFHYFSMILLVAFALLASWMYIARNRRVTALLQTLRIGDSSAAAAPLHQPMPVKQAAPEPARAPASVTGSWAGKLRVARIFQETNDTKTFRLAPLEGSALPFMFEPGQFLTITISADGKSVRRSYSIASSPCCQGWCDITVKRAAGGIVSAYLHERVQVGDPVEASGPYGHFTFRGHEAPSVIMIAGGVGITPLMSSIRYLTDQSWNGRIDLIYACAKLDAIIFREELDYLARRHPNLHVTIALSDEPSSGWTGARGYVTSELLARVPDIRSRRIHLCGPAVMMDAVKKALGDLGVPGDSIKTELFLSAAPTQRPVPVLASEVAVTCSFARSQKSAPLLAGQTVLECAESAGVAIEYACRQGFCGVCKVKLLEGDVTMEVQDGLTPADKSSGLILACQAKSNSNVTVDA